jgi:alcohol dehydrogenase/propanol-preferring alcohol dehydrogenase
LRKAEPFPHDNSLVIVSAGGLGLLALKIAKAAYGVNPIVLDIDDEKLKVAKNLGASCVINTSKENAAEKIMEATGGGAKSIVDFVGAEASVNLGYQCLAKGGTQVVVGLFGGQMNIALPLMTLTEKKLMGSYVGSLGEMKDLMKLVSAGKIEPVEVESRDVSEANRTLEEMKSGKLLGLVSLTHK